MNKLFDLAGKNKIALVKILEDRNGNPVYRQADENGKPIKTVLEKYKIEKFKAHVSPLVANSLFPDSRVAAAMEVADLTRYLDLDDTRSSSCVSKVPDEAGKPLNSSQWKEANVKAEKETEEKFSLRP